MEIVPVFNPTVILHGWFGVFYLKKNKNYSDFIIFNNKINKKKKLGKMYKLLLLISSVLYLSLSYTVGKVPNWAIRYGKYDGYIDSKGFTHRYIKAKGQTTLHVMTIGNILLPKMVLHLAIPATPLAVIDSALILKDHYHVIIISEKGLGDSSRPTVGLTTEEHKLYSYEVLAMEVISVIDEYLGNDAEFNYLCYAEGCLAFWLFNNYMDISRIKGYVSTAVHSPSGVNPARGIWYKQIISTPNIKNFLQYECGEGIGSLNFNSIAGQMSKMYRSIDPYMSYKIYESAEFLSRTQGTLQNLWGKVAMASIDPSSFCYMNTLYQQAINNINAGIYDNISMLHIAGGYFGGHSTDLFDGTWEMYFNHPLDVEKVGYRIYAPDTAKNYEEMFHAGNLKLQWYPQCGQQTYLEKSEKYAYDVIRFLNHNGGTSSYTLVDEDKFCGYDGELYQLGGKWCNKNDEQCSCVDNNVRICSDLCEVSDYKRIKDIRDVSYFSDKSPDPQGIVQFAYYCHMIHGIPYVKDEYLRNDFMNKINEDTGVHQQMWNDIDADIHN